jgi:D-alanine-D-alanine ligase
LSEGERILKIAILLGGDSLERDVSLETGRCVAAALRELGHEILPLDPTRGAEVLPQDPDDWGGGPTPRPPELIQRGGCCRSAFFSAVETCRQHEAELIFNALHGGIGENGTVQGYLDLVGIPYTGSGMLACALAMDKTVAKKLFEQEGIRVPGGITVPRENGPDIGALLRTADPPLTLPVVVKPNDQGSTVGLSIVRRKSELPGAFREAARYSRTVLVEEYIPGRELTVALLEDRALPVVEIIPEGGLYDYTCKYTDGKSRLVADPDLPAEVNREVQDMSMDAFGVLGCYGYARADFRLSPENVPCLLEINTLPGLTSHSLVPLAARAGGVEFHQLVERIVALALAKG